MKTSGSSTRQPAPGLRAHPRGSSAVGPPSPARSTIVRFAAIVLLAAACFLSPVLQQPARAEPAWNQLGLAAYTGLARGRPTAQGTPSGPLAGLALQLRLLRLFGGELAFRLADRAGPRDFDCLQPDYRLTGTLAIVPKERLDLLLRAGLGANDPADLLAARGATTSYHFGAALELDLVEHLRLLLGVLVHLPGFTPVQQRIEQSERAPRLREMVNLDNWEATVGLGFRL